MNVKEPCKTQIGINQTYGDKQPLGSAGYSSQPSIGGKELGFDVYIIWL